MTEIHRLPVLEDVEWQAAAWIERLQADDCTEADRERCQAWRREHPLHERVYQEMMATYRELLVAAPAVRVAAFGAQMHAATRPRRHGRRWMAAAAVLVLALVPLWHQWQVWMASRFETGIGEMAALTLPDGSRMELNSDSAARVSYSDEARVIHLDRGEAYFAVAHDTARPFWVVTGTTWVRAVGTAFNVYRREDDVRVTVSEGQVKVAAVAGHRETPSDEVLAVVPVSVLAAGEQVDVRPTGPAKRALPPPAVEREVAWRTGTLHFQDRPLAEVAQELARYTPLRIELAANARDVRMGGTFQTNPKGVEAWLKALHDGFGLEVHRDGDRVIVQQH